jgi:hypothetical protein
VTEAQSARMSRRQLDEAIRLAEVLSCADVNVTCGDQSQVRAEFSPDAGLVAEECYEAVRTDPAHQHNWRGCWAETAQRLREGSWP